MAQSKIVTPHHVQLETHDSMNLARLTTEVVVAYVSGNTMPQSDLPRLIEVVSRGLQGIGQAAEETEPLAWSAALKIARKAIGLRELERRTGISRHAILYLEKGERRPHRATLEALRKGLGKAFPRAT